MLSLILTIAIVGLIVYLITLIPMPEPFRTIIIVVAAICVILYVLNHFGISTPFKVPGLK